MAAGFLLTGGAFAWGATALRPFTVPALVVVLGGGVAAMACGRLVRPPSHPARLRLPGRPVVWAALLAVLAGWELTAFAQHPRSEHPTISSVTNGLFESHAVRAVTLWLWLSAAAVLAAVVRPGRARLAVLAAWLWVGWHLFVRAGYG